MTKLVEIVVGRSKAAWRAPSLVQLSLAVTLLASGASCSHKPEEPPIPESSSTAFHVADLKYSVPDGWATVSKKDEGVHRGAYSVPKVGEDKEDGELLVLFFGTGSRGDKEKQWGEWFGQFDGDPKKNAKQASFDGAGENKVETFEWKGNYKLDMGKQHKGMAHSPVQMVKNDFRIIGAVVHTKDRGNCFFRLVGPDATIQAAKPDFLAMLKAAQ